MKTKLLFIGVLFSILTINAQFWIEQGTGLPTSRGLNNISIVDENIVWASAYDGSGADPAANVDEFLKTTDGGTTWTHGEISHDGLLRIAMIQGMSADEAWAVGFKGSGHVNIGVFHTADAGATWQRQSTAAFNSTGSFINVVHFWDTNLGFCQGDPVGGYFELYTTTNGGTLWTRVPSANIPAPLNAEEFGTVGYIASAGGTRLWWTTNKGRIFRSDDNGHNWVAFQSPITDAQINLSFWDDNNGMFITNEGGGVFKTTDGGENWEAVYADSGEAYGNNISCIPGTNKVITSGGSHSGGERGSSYSSDLGSNWTATEEGDRLKVSFKDINNGWAAGFSNDDNTSGIWKYNTGLSAVNNALITTFKAFPNPVNDILTFEGNDIITNIILFNILGQNIMEISPNKLNANLDMSDLHNGTYFAKVTINNATETMKIVK